MVIIWEIPDFPTKGTTMKVEVESFQWGTTPFTSTSVTKPAEGSVAAIQEIVVRHKVDNFSNSILREIVRGTGHPMNFYFLKASGKTVYTYITYHLEEGVFTNYNISDVGEGPMESISINFTKITSKHEPAPKI